MPVNRLRRAYNWCYIRARPIRRALRDPKQRYLILKWSLAGMLAYLLLYTSFYIVLRNEYLFSMDVSSSELLDLYTSDLKVCWHSKDEESLVTKLPMSIVFHNEHTLQFRKNDNNSSQNAIRSVLVAPHKNHVYGEHIGAFLDAGMCIATPINSNNMVKNNNNPSKSKPVKDSNATDSHAHNNTPPHLRTIDSTRYTTRCLPHFIIAGAMKCGTGELMKWLQLHPNLAVGSNLDKRELHYFTGISGAGVTTNNSDSEQDGALNKAPHNKLRGNHSLTNRTESTTHHTIRRRIQEISNTKTHTNNLPHAQNPSKLVEYAQFFPAFDQTQLGDVLTFEKSPDYIRDPTALKLIRTYMPSVKMIVLLRNPVLRALSEFSHHCRHQRYVKLTRNVTIDSIQYTSGSVYRNDVHSTHSGKFPSFPVNSYEVLTYPCSAADAEAYFNMQNNMHHHKMHNKTMKADAVNNTTLPNATVINTIPTSNSTIQQPSRVHYVPEIEHGIYDHQLSALYEIFPAEQILVLLQEDMYSHTFRTLRQVESFLKIGCFDYQEYAIIPTNSVATKPELDPDGENTGDDSLTDDMNLFERKGSTNQEKNHKKAGKKKKGHKKHAKPPRRAPRTYEEKMRHYKAELAQYLASWKGLAMTPSVNLYDNTSPAFKEYLHSVYTTSNNKLSALLYDRYKNEAFSKEHLMEMGWDMGV